MKSSSSLTTACPQDLFIPLERRYLQHFPVSSEHDDRLPLRHTLSQQCCAPRVCTKIPGSVVASSPDILIQVCAESVSNRHLQILPIFQVPFMPSSIRPSRIFPARNGLIFLWPLADFSVNYFYVAYTFNFLVIHVGDVPP